MKTMRNCRLAAAFCILTSLFSIPRTFAQPASAPGASYWLPFEEGKTYLCMQGNDTTFTHKGTERYAFDFAMPEGTKITAARGGKVIEAREDLSEGGLRQDLWGKGNVVVIDHGDGTAARYLHLVKDGALVNVGDVVNAGDVIALAGATGYASGPHLHFVVKKGNQPVPVRFEDVEENGGVPAQGIRCTSRNTPAIPPALREELMRLAREADLAWTHDAFGLAWPRYKKIADAKVTVPFPPVDAAKERMAALEKKCEELTAVGGAPDPGAPDPGGLAAAAERVLLAKNSFSGTPYAPRIARILDDLKKQEGYPAAAKEADKKVRSQDQLYRAIQLELSGQLPYAARAYESCARILPDWKYCQAAEARRKDVLSRIPPPAAPRR
jgi:murein DD-endopeptidase MepM/ murein hydrolase activator NlpD